MIVVDASAALEVLLGGPGTGALTSRLFASGQSLHAPQLIDLEVAQGLQRHVLAGIMTAERGDLALETWRSLPLRRWGHEALLCRTWALRATLTAYDAAYVALAEALDAVLVTTDGKIARSPGHQARVEVVGRSEA